MKGLVIFDLDGTLLCTHHHICKAVKDTLSAVGLPDISNDMIIDLIGETSDVFFTAIAPECKNIKQFKTLFRKNEHIALLSHGKLFESIPVVLSNLVAQGFQLAICSCGSMEYIELALNNTGLRDLFHSVISSKEYASKTEAIKEIITSSKHENVIVVGDKYHDFIAAKDNFIPSIAAVYGYGSANEITMASFIAESPDAIYPLVMQITLYSRIYSKIKNLPNVRCIGVNGVDTSGKSFFADRFATFLKSKGESVTIINLDDFHNQKSMRLKGHNEVDAYINNAFDLDTLVSELLLPIRNTGKVSRNLDLLDLDSDTYTLKRSYEIEPGTFVILEGVLLYRPPIENFIDYKIFLEISFDEVINRASIRDVPKYGSQFLDKYREKYIPIQQWYLESCDPKGKSNAIVDNSDYKNPTLNFMA